MLYSEDADLILFCFYNLQTRIYQQMEIGIYELVVALSICRRPSS